MAASKEVIGTNLLKLTYTADAEQVEKGLAYSFNKNKKFFSVKGFRVGHAPRPIVERYYGVEVLFDDASDYIMNEMYVDSIQELGFTPVSKPQNVELVKMSREEMEFTLEVYTKPEVRLGQYKGLEITDVSSELTEEDIENALKSEAEKNSRMVTVEDRPAENGDTVNIDFEGFMDGAAFEGGDGKNYKLKLGSGQFIPGFEEQLVGANTGDDVTVKVKFPEDYHAEKLKGKDAEFKVKINEIQKQEIPEINDEFASDVSEFDTLAEYRENLAGKLSEEKKKTSKSAMTEEALRKAVDNAEVEIPECMIDDAVDSEYQRTERSVNLYGMTMESYCGRLGTTTDEFRKNIRPQAALNVKRDLVLEAIAAAEDIQASEDDFDEEFKKVAEYMNITPEEAKKRYGSRRDDIAEDIRQRKAVELLLETAVKTAPVDTSDEGNKDSEKAEQVEPKKQEKQEEADA